MIKIPEEFIRENFTPADFLRSCHEAFVGYGNGTYVMQPREENLQKGYRDGLDRFTLRMPAKMPGYEGYKFIEEFSSVTGGSLGGNRTAVIRLKPENGEEAEMDAGYITHMRTGAAGALGVKYFVPHPESVSILGTGNVAKAAAMCVAELGVAKINAYSRTAEKREEFRREIGSSVSAEVVLHDSLKSCVAGCDAVIAAVPTPEPIIYLGDLQKCRYISCMGGDSRTAQLGEDIMTNAWIIPDNYEQCMKSGDFRKASEGGYLGKVRFMKRDDRILNIGDAANGRIQVPDSLLVGYFSGLASQDIAAAGMVYEEWNDKRKT